MEMKPILYLSHPCTTFGNIKENEERARVIQNNLRDKGNPVISPLDIIPRNMEWKPAMILSRKLYIGTEALVIGSVNWFYSKGCVEEVKWALFDNKPIYLYGYGNDGTDIKLADEKDIDMLRKELRKRGGNK